MIEDILWLISSSPEVLEDCKVTIRRNEKQALNAMNAAPGQLYRMTKAVHKAVNGPENKLTKPSKRLPRITTASQKVFVLLAHIMSTNRLHQSTRQLQGTRCSGQSDQSALRYDLARVSKAAGRMVAAIAEYYSDKDFGDSNQTTATLHRAACTVLEALTLGQGEQ